MLNYAKRYLELGFCIHPCCPTTHGCSKPGKIPYDPETGQHMKGWQNHDRPSIDKCFEWFGNSLNLNIGCLCGEPSSLVFIDIDSQSGRQLFVTMSGGSGLETWRYTTGKGERYIYKIRVPIGSFKVRGDATFFEVLGNGSQTILPPSLHSSGKMYEWVKGFTPKDIDVLPIPQWLLDLSSKQEVITSETEEINWEEFLSSPLQEGERNEQITKLVGHLMSPAPLPIGEVHRWISLYNKTMVNPPLPDNEIKTIIASISKREGASRELSEEEREIRRIMKEEHCNRSRAELLYNCMED